MKAFAIPAAALTVLSVTSFSGAKAAPVYAQSQSNPASIYTQVDCMDQDGDAHGCWRVGPDYGPYSGSSFGQDLGRQRASDLFNSYRSYYDNGSNAKAGALHFGSGR